MPATAEPRNLLAFQCLVLLSIGELKSRSFGSDDSDYETEKANEKTVANKNATNRQANTSKNKQKTNKYNNQMQHIKT